MPAERKTKKTSGRDSFAYLTGSFLYYIGFQAEYILVKLSRIIWRVVLTAAHIFRWVWQAIITQLKPVFITVGQELTAPWRQAVSGIKNIHGVMKKQRRRGSQKDAIKEGSAYFARGFKIYSGTLKRAFAYVLPLAAAALFAFTAHTVLSANYALAVNFNGQLLGFIENEKVYADALSLVQSRIQANTDGREFDIDTTLNVVSVSAEALSTRARLADAMVKASGDDVIEAVGYMLDGVLIGATTDSTPVQQVMDDAMQPYINTDNPNMRVEFIRNLTAQAGVYFTDTLESASTIISRLQGSAPYTASDGTQQAANLLLVKQVERVEFTREIPYSQVRQNDASLEWGTEVVAQAGVNGSENVIQEITYVDGTAVSAQDIETTVIIAPIDEVTRVGVQSEYGVVGEIGTGDLIWPVPEYTGVSRGISYYHRGLDITAKAGTPILAADNGVVEFSGNGAGTANWSYGIYVKIDHGNGMSTLYGHMIATSCSTGQYVRKGDVIGYVGSTGVSTGNHCHFETLVNNALQNPYNFVQRPS